MSSLIRRDNREVAPRPRTAGAFLDPFRVMEELLDWGPLRAGTGWGAVAGAEFNPSFEVKETKDEYVVRADLPGVSEQDLEISLTGNVIQISGQREQETQQEGDRFYSMERTYGRFTRSFALPEGANAERVSAELREGVLTVHIPKKLEVQPRRISVGVSGNGSNPNVKGDKSATAEKSGSSERSGSGEKTKA
jgi:HSP20 family protein